MELNSKNIKKILFIILFGVVAFAAFQNFGRVLDTLQWFFWLFSPVITALCIAFVLNVLLSALETRVFKFMDNSKRRFVKKSKRPLCIVLTYLIAFAIIVLIIAVVIPDITATVLSLAERLPSFMNEAKVWIEDTLEKFNLSQDLVPNIEINWSGVGSTLKDILISNSNRIFGDTVNITTSVISGVYNTVFSLLISIYILAQKERIGRFIKRFMKAFLPEKAAYTIFYVADKTYTSFSRFISGQLTEAVILGVLCFIGMTIFRFPNAAVISIFIGAAALVPIVGATIGAIFGFLLIIIVSPIKALLFIVFFIVLQQLEGSLIYPKVVGKSVGLPGVIVVCAVLVGGNIGGILGALISVPICAVLYVLLREAINKRLSAEKEIKKTSV